MYEPLSKEPPGRLKPVRDGTFKHLVAELNPNPTQYVWVDDFLDGYPATDLLGEGRSEPVALFIG